MLNLIRADLYRLIHTKSFWLTEGILSFFVIFSIVVSGGFSTSANEAQEGVAALTGYSAIIESINGMWVYYILPLIILVLGVEYSKGTLKNIITVGISRPSFFFGKFVSYTVVLFLQMVGLTIINFVLGTIAGGTGLSEENNMRNIIYYMLSTLFILLAISAVTLLALYLTKNTAVSVIVSIIAPMVIMVTYMMKTDWRFLEFVNFQYNIELVTSTTLASISDVDYIFFGAGAVLTVCLIATSWYFNRQDL